ncbi:hypothetical protein QUF70_14450 [Desulfobacterales bacterium HSG17]|nr:hypothetical protein [Desulfobacterales bacterium HSG17]
MSGEIFTVIFFWSSQFPFKSVDTIPVLGKFITGDGIIATNYTATGPYRDPDVKIEPMSTLAIGGIRKIIDNLKLQKPSDTRFQENTNQGDK